MNIQYQETTASQSKPLHVVAPLAPTQESAPKLELRFFTIPEIADLLQMKRERV